MKKDKITLTTPAIMAALRERYAAPEYAFLDQVRSQTGYGPATIRTADGLAMSLYPSRGLELIGCEVKASRSDWLREKKDPAKAEEILRFCDRWYLVVGDESIVQDDELPPPWGLLVPGPRGGLRQKVEAPKLSAEPMTRAMLAGLLRNVSDAQKTTVQRSEIELLMTKAREEGRLAGMSMGDAGQIQRLITERDALQKMIDDFEAASGVELRFAWNAGDIGAAVKMVNQFGPSGASRRIRDMNERMCKELKVSAARMAKIEQEAIDPNVIQIPELP